MYWLHRSLGSWVCPCTRSYLMDSAVIIQNLMSTTLFCSQRTVCGRAVKVMPRRHSEIASNTTDTYIQT
jgi:hypothetical protein